MVSDVPEPPIKKLRRELQEDQVSSTMDNRSEMLGEIRQTSTVPELIESSQPCSRDRIPSNSQSFQAPFMNKGKTPISSHMGPRDRELGYEAAFCAPSYSNQTTDGIDLIHMQREKSPRDHEDEEIKPKKKQYVNDLPHFVVPTSKAHSGNCMCVKVYKQCVSA